jgi:WD40 repeat protein
MSIFVSDSLTVARLPSPVLDKNSSIIEWLPGELILNILSRVSKEDVYHFALAERTTAEFIRDPYLWRLLFARDFPERLPLVAHLRSTTSSLELYRMPVVTRTNIRHNRAQITALPSHTEKVTSLICRGRLLVTGDTEGTVKVSAKDREGKFQEVQTIQPCKGGFFQLSPEQDYLFFPQENVLKIYKRTETGEFKEIQSLNVDGTEIRRFKMDGENLTISTNQNSVLYRKDQDGLFQEYKRLEGFHLALVSGDYLFAAQDDERVQILKKNATGEYQSQMNYLNDSPAQVLPTWIFFENGHLIIANCEGVIRIWKQEKNGLFTGPKVFDVRGDFMNFVNCIEVKEDYIFVGMKKGQLIILKKDEKGEFQVSPNSETHGEKINALITYENYLMTGSIDGTVKVWEKGAAGVYAFLQTLSDPGLAESITTISMEDSKLVAAYFSGAVRIWDFCPRV